VEATPGPGSTRDQASEAPGTAAAERIGSSSEPRPYGRPHARPATRGLTPATLAALVILVLSALASFAFVLARGGLTLPTSPTRAAVALPSPSVAAAEQSPEPIASAGRSAASSESSPTAEPTLSPVHLPSPSARASAIPAASASVPSTRPRPTSAPEPTGRSARYALLAACPGTSDCWIYTIRPGDNVYSIARYFGHSLETVYRLNPWTRTARLHRGDELFLPSPTR
jgi:hypothetical protein